MKRATIDVALLVLVALSLLCNDNPRNILGTS